MTEQQKPTPQPENGPTPKRGFDEEIDVALNLARIDGPPNPARIAENMIRNRESGENIRDSGIFRQGEAFGRRKAEIAGKKKGKGMLAGVLGIGLVAGAAGAVGFDHYQETHEHHVVFEDITPGLISGETTTQAIAASVQSYIDAHDIDPGMFPSEDVHEAALAADGQWKELSGLDYVDTGAQFKVTISANKAGDLDVEAEAVDPN